MKNSFNQHTENRINDFISSFITIFPGVYKEEEIRDKINNNLNFNIEYSTSLETDYYYNPFLKTLTINNKNTEQQQEILFKALLKIIMTNKEKNKNTVGFENLNIMGNSNFYINEIFLNTFKELYREELKKENCFFTDKLNLTKQLYIVTNKKQLLNYITKPEIEYKKNKIKFQRLNATLEELDNLFKEKATNSMLFQKIGEVEFGILELYDITSKKEEEILNDLNALLKITQNPNLEAYYKIINSIKEKDKIKNYSPLYEIYTSIDLIKKKELKEAIDLNTNNQYIPIILYQLKELFSIKQDTYDSTTSFLNNKDKYNTILLYNNYQLYKNIISLVKQKEIDINEEFSINYNQYVNYEIPIHNLTIQNNQCVIENSDFTNSLIFEDSKDRYIVQFDEKNTYVYKKQDEKQLLQIYDFSFIKDLIEENIEVYENAFTKDVILLKENQTIQLINKDKKLPLNDELHLFNRQMKKTKNKE